MFSSLIVPAVMDPRLSALLESNANNCRRQRESLTRSAAAQIDEIKKSSMSSRDKRSALYRVKRNLQTEAQRSFERAKRMSLMFGSPFEQVPADFLPDIDFSILLKEDVTIDQTPADLPSIDEVLARHTKSSPKREEIQTKMEDLPSSSSKVPVQLVPIAVQPIGPLTRYAHAEITKNVKSSIVKKVLPYKTYFELTMQQIFQYIKAFGYGAEGLPSDLESLIPNYNHHMVVSYMTSLRSCSTESSRFVGILIESQHPAYSISGNLTGNRLLNGLQLASADVVTTQRAIEWANALKYFRGGDGTAGNANDSGMFKKIPYTEDWSGLSGGGNSILSHLLMWLRKDLRRNNDDFTGENILHHHGYFYDPEYCASYMTFGLEEALQKLRQYRGSTSDSNG